MENLKKHVLRPKTLDIDKQKDTFHLGVFTNSNLISIGTFVKENNDKIKITKLAQGLPVGGEIEQLDDGTLFSAFKNRVPVTD